VVGTADKRERPDPESSEPEHSEPAGPYAGGIHRNQGAFMKSLAITGCAVVWGAGILVLSGCAPEPGAPTPGPTVTVTATPETPARATSDPLTILDAWLACSSAVQGDYALANGGTEMLPYDATMVSEGASGGFIVKVNFRPPGGSITNTVAGALGVCTVSGTVGEPVIRNIAFSDLG
jgi:hypothetical protein